LHLTGEYSTTVDRLLAAGHGITSWEKRLLKPCEAAATITEIEVHPAWLEDLPEGSKCRVRLREGGAAVPVLLAKGRLPGPCLVVTAGVHGDEFEGIRALFEVFEEVEPETMTGTLLAVPVAHPAAFEVATRRSPLDSCDMARAFPGDRAGTPTEQTAALLANHVIARADLFLDLHSGGTTCEMPSMVGCDATDPRSLTAARAFGAEVLWMHDRVGPGRTISFAKSRNIPWLYTEAAGGGRIRSGDLQMMKRGVLNLLSHTHILPNARSTTGSASLLTLRGDGNTDCGIQASADGLIAVRVRLLEEVCKGAPLGELLDEFGRVIETFRAPRAGIVTLIHQFARVRSGETLFLLAERA
jgi:predicted deacylase